ncbi:lysis protein [Winslowiella arboricola]|uniref:lysis protein n=1 Tax=Winslowiella arboricola TaxID=2978220 RepID=UPI00225DE841|nr:lysis protein [Winslowiella arboricola]MCU5775213.1 lysis protein [Winslowiella arboricola]
MTAAIFIGCLKNYWRFVLFVLLLLLCVGIAKIASHYHEKYQEANHLAETRKETIDDMQRRQKSVAALDEKYTKELADAQATIDQLESDVRNGSRRLQLNASCQKQSTTGTSSLDDATRARLADSAQRDYFTLRQRIEIAGKQIAGLQQYIKEQCMR